MGQRATIGFVLPPPGQVHVQDEDSAATTGTRQLPGNREGYPSEEPTQTHPLTPLTAPWPLPLTESLGMLAFPGQSCWALEAAGGPGHYHERET